MQIRSQDELFRWAKSPLPSAIKRHQTEWGSRKPYSWNCSTSLRMLCYANNRKKNSDTHICGGAQGSFRALPFHFSELDKQACNTFYIRPYSHNCSLNLRIKQQAKPHNPMLSSSMPRRRSVNKVYENLFSYSSRGSFILLFSSRALLSQFTVLVFLYRLIPTYM